MKEMILQNRYIIKEEIGHGGFGKTYRAMDSLLDIPVAVKEYLTQRQMSEEEARRETKMAAKFYDLEGVVAARDFFTENGHVYIIFEYVDGIDIKEYINRKGRMNGQEMLQKMRPVIKALGKIHDQGVLHRDISADNLMITEAKTIKLIDFGTARFMEDYDRTYTQNSKQGFTPIEQYQRHGTQGPWTDIYSLCATIYFMITGMIPDISVDRLLDDKMVSLEEIHGTGLNKHQMQCIMKGLEIQPEQRYQDIAGLYADLYQREYKEDPAAEGKAGADRSFFTTGLSTTTLLHDIRKSLGNGKKKRSKWIVVSCMALFVCLVLGTIIVTRTQDKKMPISQGHPAVVSPAAVSRSSVSGTVQPVSAADGRAGEKDQYYKIGNYVGLSKKKVKTRLSELRENGLKVIYKKKYSAKPKGTVISQKPAAGRKYKDLGKISLTIVLSRGKKPAAAVPAPTASPAPKLPSKKKPVGSANDSVEFSGDLDDIPG